MKLRRPLSRISHRWTLALALATAATAILAITAFAAAAGNTPTTSKRAKLQQIAAQATAAAKSPHAPKHPAGPPTSCPMPLVQSGITVGIPAGFPDHIVNVAVVAPQTGRPFEYEVFAGSQLDNPRQGVLIVVRMDRDPCAPGAAGTKFKTYETPSQQGDVTLTQLSGDSVSFTTAAGGSGHFDYITGQFS